MIVSEVSVTPVKPAGSLVAFASLIIGDNMYIGSMAVHKRLDGAGYRIVYPAKNIGEHQFSVYHPINKQTGQLIEQAITEKCHELFESRGA